MTGLRELIVGNWPLKLASIGLATVLYAGVAVSDGTRTWAGPVPIDVLAAPAGGALLELPGAVDEIIYRAPPDVASQLTAGSFRASIDLSGVEPRVGAEPVEVPVDISAVDPRVRIVDYSPRGVNVRLDEVVTRSMPVDIDVGTVPDGIELGPVLADPRSVTVRGAGSRIANVRLVGARVGVDASGINIDQDVQVEAFDEVGALVPGVDIDPPLVRVSADVARQLAYSTLPIVPDLVGTPPAGWHIDSVTVTPSVATVSGEDPSIRAIASVSTEPIDLSGQDSSFTTEVGLALPEEVTAPAVPAVSVSVVLAPTETTRALEVGTVLRGAEEGLDYDFDAGSVRIVVSGRLADLDVLDIGALVAELPVGGLPAGDYRITPTLALPDGVAVERMEPTDIAVSVAGAR